MPTLELTTTVGCPLMCTFCPQDALKKSYVGERKMTIEGLATILSTVPTYVRIDFSGFSEPWSNPDCTELLRHTFKMGYQVAIYTTLQGVKDPYALVGVIREHHDQVETVVIHLPDDHGNMRGFRHSEEYDAALRAFVAYDRERALRSFKLMTMSEDGAVSPLLANHRVRVEDWLGNARAGSLDLAAIGGQPVRTADWSGRVVSCSYTPFYDQNVVMPNGDVVLCCMDYGMKTRIGNLMTGDYASLFSSEGMNSLRAANSLCGGETICKKCSRATRYRVSDTKQYWVGETDLA